MCLLTVTQVIGVIYLAHGEMLKKDRLHRDVSYGNILINRVEKPYAAGLLIDLEYSIKLSTNMDRQKATGHRTVRKYILLCSMLLLMTTSGHATIHGCEHTLRPQS